MDRKKIIQIVVIIIAFGGSGIVLYNGLYRPKSLPPSLLTALGPGGLAAPSPVAAGGSGNDLLPYGRESFAQAFEKTVDSHRFQFNAISFPVVSTSTEVGLYDDARKAYTQPLIK